jgi:diketogulonate reductase-like aldo/keto reductase
MPQAKGILVEAYSPVAHGAMLNDAEIWALAENTASASPQLCIRYCLQLGPAATAEDRQSAAHAQQRRASTSRYPTRTWRT